MYNCKTLKGYPTGSGQKTLHVYNRCTLMCGIGIHIKSNKGQWVHMYEHRKCKYVDLKFIKKGYHTGVYRKQTLCARNAP